MDTINVGEELVFDKGDAAAIATEVDVGDFFDREADRLGRALGFAAILVDLHAPEAHVAIAITNEIKVEAVGAPERIPINGGIIGEGDGLGSNPVAGLGTDGEEIALPRAGGPEGNALAIGAPTGLDGVALVDEAAGVVVDANGPKLARGSDAIFGANDPFGGTYDFGAVGAPGGVVADGGDLVDLVGG